MAAQINKKFIAVLLLIILCGVGVVGGLWFLKYRGDASRNIRRADAFLQQNDHSAAVGELGKAVRKDPGNMEYLQRFQETLLQITPSTPAVASERYGQYLESLRRGARYQASDPQRHLQLMEELLKAAWMTDLYFGTATSTWQRLADSADAMLMTLSESEPERAWGYLYRGLATAKVREAREASDYEQARADIEQFLDQVPDSDLGWSSLVLMQLQDARMADIAGRPADDMYQKAYDMVEEALQQVPDGPLVARAHLRTLLMRSADEDIPVEQINAEAARMASLVKPDDPSWLISEVVEAILQLGGEERIMHAINLLEEMVDEERDPILHRFQLARAHKELQNWDRVDENVDRVLNAEPQKVSYIAQAETGLKIAAVMTLVDSSFIQWELAEPGERAEHLAKLKEARDLLLDYVADPETSRARVLADAKIAFAEREYSETARLLDELTRIAGLADLDLLLLAARTQESLGNTGAALDYLNQAIAKQPRAPVLLYHKARFEAGQGDLSGAERTIAQLRSIDPDYRPERVQNLLTSINPDAEGDLLATVDRLIRQNSLDAARQQLMQGLAGSPDDLRYITRLALVEMQAGNQDQAREYIERGLTVDPDNSLLLRYQALVENQQPVEAIEQWVHSRELDEVEEAFALLVNFYELAERQEGIAERMEAMGQQEQAAQAREIEQQARDKATEALQRARAAASDDPRLIEYEFAIAIDQEDWQQAEAMVDEAVSRDLDKAGGDYYRARLLMAQEQYNQAASLLQDVTRQRPYEISVWRRLGEANLRAGNAPAALEAYERAWEIKPTDLRTVKDFVTTLVRVGENIRALDVIRRARNVSRTDPEIRHLWLTLEYEVGDAGTALAEREKTWRNNPQDRNNAVQLAVIYSQSQPSRRTVLNDQGNPRYSEQAWRRLSPREQQEVLRSTRRRWREQAGSIIDQMMDEVGETRELVALKASLLREVGEPEEGEQVLREYLESLDQPQEIVAASVALSRYLRRENRMSDAVAVLQEARDHQSEEQREIDNELGVLHFQMRNYEQAIAAFERVAEVAESQTVEQRMIEALIRLGRLEDADDRMTALVDEYGMNLATWLLTAQLLEQEAVQLTESGDGARAEFKYQQARDALDSAQELAPNNIQPMLQLAEMLARRAQRTGEMRYIDESLEALADAESIRSGSSRVADMRIQLLLAKGEHRAAISELTSRLERDPENRQLRERLVQLHIQNDNLDAAERLLRDAVNREPESAYWHRRVGDFLLGEREQLQQAAESYERSFQLEQSTLVMRKVAELSLLLDEEETLARRLRQQYAERFDSDFELMCINARLHAIDGEDDQAIDILEDAYSKIASQRDNLAVYIDGVGQWYRSAQVVFGDDVHGLEQMAQELSGGELSPVEARWLGRAWIQLGTQGAQRAISLQRQAISNFPDQRPAMLAQLHGELASYFLSINDYEGAAAEFRASADLQPTDPVAANNYAYLLAEFLNEPDKALPYAERAVQLGPGQPQFLDTLGWVHYKLGNLAQAEQSLEQANSRRPTADSLVKLARVQLAAGNPSRAATTLEQAAGLEPDADTQRKIEEIRADIEAERGR